MGLRCEVGEDEEEDGKMEIRREGCDSLYTTFPSVPPELVTTSNSTYVPTFHSIVSHPIPPSIPSHQPSKFSKNHYSSSLTATWVATSS